MGINLQNHMSVSLYIDGAELPIDGAMTLGHFKGKASLTRKVPTFNMELVDTIGAVSAAGLMHDGAKIQLVLEVAGIKQTYNWRLFKWHRVPNGRVASYWVEGYLDSPLWWAGTSTSVVQGTSSEVIARIAQQCSVACEVDPTADAKLWVQQGRTYSTFAAHIARHGWASDASCMVLGYDMSNLIVYKDAGAVKNPVWRVTNGKVDDKSIYVHAYFPESHAGAGNKHAAYQSTLHRQSLVKPSVHKHLTVTPNTANPQRNSQIVDTIQTGYPRHSLIDVGNSSEVTELGRHQNIRIGHLFTQKITAVSTMQPMPFRLLDWVEYDMSLETYAQRDIEHSGSYITTERVFLIQGTQYFDQITGERHGTNEQEA